MKLKRVIFREDLYHRLNVFEINIKPLNERVSDIPLLINYFSNLIGTVKFLFFFVSKRKNIT